MEWRKPHMLKKNAKGRKATMVRFSLKSSIISGTNGPIILVKNDITKKTNRIRAMT